MAQQLSNDRWVQFFTPYFTSEAEARRFVEGCRNPGRTDDTANQIMQQVRRMVLLADEFARPGRDSLPLLFFTICAENTSRRQAGEKAEGGSHFHVRRFFEQLTSGSDRRMLGEAFVGKDGNAVGLQPAVKLLYGVRCKVAHEGVYWDFAFSGPQPPRKRAPAVQARISYQDLRSIVVRGGITAALSRLDSLPEPVPASEARVPERVEAPAPQKTSGDRDRLLQAHRAYLSLPFDPEITRIGFSDQEWRTLVRRGAWMEALADGQLEPRTAAQARFVQVARGLLPAEREHELLWEKFELRRAFGRVGAPLGTGYLDYEAPDAYFGSAAEEWSADTYDYDAELDLLRSERDSDSEDWARSGEDGWYYDD
jgi:Protein of unknown function, DUF